ncbi:hypothetical protein KAI36_02676 [Paenibacillus sp. S02]|nr:hypothetical protein KAI36_02676 [Paenibacillus sp. S02]
MKEADRKDVKVIMDLGSITVSCHDATGKEDTTSSAQEAG